MIKRITILTRKPGTTHDEFVRHWTKVHAALLGSHPSVSRLVANDILEFKRFGVRNPDLARPAQNVQPAFEPDGFWELWFHDRELMEAMYVSDFRQRARGRRGEIRRLALDVRRGGTRAVGPDRLMPPDSCQGQTRGLECVSSFYA